MLIVTAHYDTLCYAVKQIISPLLVATAMSIGFVSDVPAILVCRNIYYKVFFQLSSYSMHLIS